MLQFFYFDDDKCTEMFPILLHIKLQQWRPTLPNPISIIIAVFFIALLIRADEGCSAAAVQQQTPRKKKVEPLPIAKFTLGKFSIQM